MNSRIEYSAGRCHILIYDEYNTYRDCNVMHWVFSVNNVKTSGGHMINPCADEFYAELIKRLIARILQLSDTRQLGEKVPYYASLPY